MNKIRLGVNIDHVATVRQARKAVEPDPVAAAVLAELAGAHGITVHIRSDRRHIQGRDLELLRGFPLDGRRVRSWRPWERFPAPFVIDTSSGSRSPIRLSFYLGEGG